MHPEHGAGVQEVEGKVSLGDGVERVDERSHAEQFGRARRVHGMRRPGQSRRPQGRGVRRFAGRVEAFEIPLERPEVG
jgi:hypothetical protein